jgi:zinc transporter ZupT
MLRPAAHVGVASFPELARMSELELPAVVEHERPLGLLVFFAVLAHDFADGLNTVSFILRQTGDRASAIRWLAIDAAAPLLRAIVGSSLSISEEHLGSLLAVYVGFFVFMGATDLLPHAHEHPSVRRVLLTVTGFAAVLAASLVGGH